jgi:hypothetical protein
MRASKCATAGRFLAAGAIATNCASAAWPEAANAALPWPGWYREPKCKVRIQLAVAAKNGSKAAPIGDLHISLVGRRQKQADVKMAPPDLPTRYDLSRCMKSSTNVVMEASHGRVTVS